MQSIFDLHLIRIFVKKNRREFLTVLQIDRIFQHGADVVRIGHFPTQNLLPEFCDTARVFGVNCDEGKFGHVLRLTPRHCAV